MDNFKEYHSIWQKDRDETVAEFLASEPKLNDFQNMIQYYRDLEENIQSQPEFYNVGALALFTGMVSAPPYRLSSHTPPASSLP